ncbi:hypothetical protein CFC21_051331 [Triticum aestivum]|uniref:Uncharacterized protein n=3 Tax=Triticum TaxID=4564 RepID=A0A9R1G819_WHEAT|nr:hypothetical protein TRIUR3_28703 [Triticum urartu]KAF7041551.1 hypothetical protein CFC21_051331 [Triticum aestivum]
MVNLRSMRLLVFVRFRPMIMVGKEMYWGGIALDWGTMISRVSLTLTGLGCIGIVSWESRCVRCAGECCECGDDVKHPTGVEYKKGEAKPHGRCKCINRPISDEAFNKFIVVRDEDSLEAEEARVRRQFRIRNIADGHGARGKYIVPAKRVQA